MQQYHSIIDQTSTKNLLKSSPNHFSKSVVTDMSLHQTNIKSPRLSQNIMKLGRRASEHINTHVYDDSSSESAKLSLAFSHNQDVSSKLRKDFENQKYINQDLESENHRLLQKYVSLEQNVINDKKIIEALLEEKQETTKRNTELERDLDEANEAIRHLSKEAIFNQQRLLSINTQEQEEEKEALEKVKFLEAKIELQNSQLRKADEENTSLRNKVTLLQQRQESPQKDNYRELVQLRSRIHSQHIELSDLRNSKTNLEAKLGELVVINDEKEKLVRFCSSKLSNLEKTLEGFSLRFIEVTDKLECQKPKSTSTDFQNLCKEFLGDPLLDGISRSVLKIVESTLR